MDLGLNGKPVIVCASSGGLGKATAMAFAREGARVMMCGRDEAKLAAAASEIGQAIGGEAPRTTIADLTNPADVQKLVDATVKAFGGVYTLINNTGGPPAGPFDQFDDVVWQKAFELNLLSYVRMTRAVLPHLRASGGGRIVNFTSSSIRAALDNLLLSNSFRMGVMGLSKTLASELGKDSILVNVLGPGRIQTDRLTQLDQTRATKTGTTVEQVKATIERDIPLGRYGKPEEFGTLAVFLGSPANTYVTGQALLVDGGMVKAY